MSGPGVMAEHEDKRDRLIAIDARDRAAVTDFGEGYSLFARLMRYVLPVVAVVLLATVVVWPLISGQEDGFRQVAAQEFTDIYILDLGSDVRRNPKISGTTHNVFGIQTGVAIGFFVREKAKQGR